MPGCLYHCKGKIHWKVAVLNDSRDGMLSFCVNVISICCVIYKDGSLRLPFILRQDIKNTNNSIAV